jgi:hypothetical protein
MSFSPVALSLAHLLEGLLELGGIPAGVKKDYSPQRHRDAEERKQKEEDHPPEDRVQRRPLQMSFSAISASSVFSMCFLFLFFLCVSVPLW